MKQSNHIVKNVPKSNVKDTFNKHKGETKLLYMDIAHDYNTKSVVRIDDSTITKKHF